MKMNPTTVLLLVVALELVFRWVPASASDRYDFSALVRAVEANAKATQELAREVREAGRNFRK